MAGITIEIFSNMDIRYVPGPVVRPGDTVTFQLSGISGDVQVSFDGGDSCLTTPGPILLRGGSAKSSETWSSVSTMAAARQYTFTVQLVPSASLSAGPDEMATKKGGIDVTAEP
ncbi:hypothetical protein HPC49_22530 [Pyxidicoccus fallax]|uniref:Uncharacterized protein n=1 Tax=Pyxidicoccus fallax TaxID=394095 RepID=A0A848LLS1_9BACT|nr:hypothetical protein [Pyxidicoccus fallax]NMO18661.1 hypothetical protein [Pyxidicoccus fallax]NPC80991.1 hypothetical protein [Pyxidicoccus fallax]